MAKVGSDSLFGNFFTYQRIWKAVLKALVRTTEVDNGSYWKKSCQHNSHLILWGAGVKKVAVGFEYFPKHFLVYDVSSLFTFRLKFASLPN